MSPRVGFVLRIVLLSIVLALGCEDSTEPDTTPPAAVGDLRSDRVGFNTLLLRWTAPGDDGTRGRATAYDIRISTGILDDANFAAAAALPGARSPADAGAPESLLVSGLVEDHAYSFALRTVDDAHNLSPISNVLLQTTLDATPPAQITNLGIAGTTLVAVTLGWTAPGDDESVGTAASYDVRYASEPITDTNWELATPVAAAGVPAPALAGTHQECTVEGLTPWPRTTSPCALSTR